MSLRNARGLQLLGLLFALAGLAGYWLTRDVPHAVLSSPTKKQLGITKGEFQASFVLAGRDFDYTKPAGPVVWRNGHETRTHPAQFIYSNRTDSILYVHVIGDKVYLIAIPRDIYMASYHNKINATYGLGGATDAQKAEGLKQAVSELLGVPIDYYVIINIDIFKKLIDAVGGVDVNVPEPMHYQDLAAGLKIDLDPGPQHLDGQQAEGFVRFRHTAAGDLNRIDNIKTLASAFLARLKEMNVAAVGKIPELAGVFSSEVDTNVTPALMSKLVTRLPKLEIKSATLPTCCERRIPIYGDVLGVDPKQVDAFLAATFGGHAKALAEIPDVKLLITNSSGVNGLAGAIEARLLKLGVPADQLAIRTGTEDPAPTRILADAAHWSEAGFYASLFHVGQQQVYSLEEPPGMDAGLELVLGEDAKTHFPLEEATLAQAKTP